MALNGEEEKWFCFVFVKDEEDIENKLKMFLNTFISSICLAPW